MNHTVEILPQYRIAYVRQVGPYGPANIQAMEKLKIWAKENNLYTSETIFGISQDNPEMTLPQNCRYDACIVIPEDYQVDDTICEGELSGGKYFIYHVKHTTEDIQNAWAEIFPTLHNSGYQIDNRPILERYISDVSEDDNCDICVPIK